MTREQDVMDIEATLHSIGSLTDMLASMARLNPKLMRLKSGDVNKLAEDLLDLHGMLSVSEAAE